MDEFRLCGYLLAARGLRLQWTPSSYEGYDREYFLEMDFLADIFHDDGSELWKLQSAALERDKYFESFNDALELCRGFERNGKLLDVLQIRVSVAHCMIPNDLQFLPPAKEAPEFAFAFVGYDVGWLLGKHSIIYQPGFMNRVEEKVRIHCASRINEHGLLRSIEDALEFRDLFYKQPQRESGDYEILEVALWREDSRPSEAERGRRSAC